MKKLKILDLSNCHISENGLTNISKLSSLNELNISFNKFSIRDMKSLNKLVNLSNLCMKSCNLIDDKLYELKNLSNLQTLNISHNKNLTLNNKICILDNYLNLVSLNSTKDKYDKLNNEWKCVGVTRMRDFHGYYSKIHLYERSENNGE